MTKEQIYIIRTALQNEINEMLHFAEVRDIQGNEESRVFFLEQANELQHALNAFLQENPT